MYTLKAVAHITVMLYKKKILKTFLLIVLAVLCSLTFTPLNVSADDGGLYLGGFPAGFVLNTTTVEVVGICEVITKDGMCSPAKNCGIKSGDIIDKINGEEVNSAADINKIVGKDYKKYDIEILRASERLHLNIKPAVELASGCKRIGVLVKDSVNGIGTVTYVDKSAGKFASLGHAVTFADGRLIEINGGSVYGCVVYDVKKGVRGTPGELRGAFESGAMLGHAALNCNCGVFGEISSEYDTSRLIKVNKAPIDEVKVGKAYIYSTLSGNKPEKYEISIAKIDKNNKDRRNFVIKVDDKRLIDISGGIVQGMSGSPIVQNGKLIGAVTHVFVNDPTRGYGIAIDRMLDSY